MTLKLPTTYRPQQYNLHPVRVEHTHRAEDDVVLYRIIIETTTGPMHMALGATSFDLHMLAGQLPITRFELLQQLVQQLEQQLALEALEQP